MRKKSIDALLILLMIMASGWGEHTVNAAFSEHNSTDTFPVTIVDHVGREVIIEEEPKTLISGYYISTSLLIALDQDEKLVGIENDGDKRPIYSLSAPNLLELPGMGTVKVFDLERCAALNPDLVILPYKLKDMENSLEQLDIPVIFVKPESQELLFETIDMIGAATASMEDGEKLKDFIQTNMKEMADALQEADKPGVYLAGNSSFLSTAGPEMYQHSLIENAGGENVAVKITDSYWAEISYEQLLAWDPEYIILAADAKYSVESVLTDENLKECTAIKNKNVYQLPNDIESWDSPVPGSVLGNLWLANVLHPEEYSASDYQDAVTEFYETFYGFTPGN